jgi:hypothetical protein
MTKYYLIFLFYHLNMFYRMGLISLKITKSKLTETYGYKLQIEFETVCFCTLAPASPDWFIMKNPVSQIPDFI